MPKIDVYNIADAGVNVDSNPVQLEDNELTKAQNCIRDPLGAEGSIRKRPGLSAINSVAAAGSITGLIGVPIGIGTAGNDIPAVSPTARSSFLARRITATTAGWNTTTDSWVTSPTTGGPDGYDVAATPRVPDYLWPGVAESGDTAGHYRAAYSGRPGVMFNNRFYYAGNDYTYQSTSPTLRVWDGTFDQLLCKVPTRSGVVAEAVIDMILGGDEMIYMTVFDGGVSSANTMKVRIFQLNPDNGTLKQMGGNFPLSPETVRTPFTLCWHQNRLWTRVGAQGPSVQTNQTYYFRPGIDADWTVDATDNFQGCNLMFSFQGQLFIGIRKDLNIASLILVRSPLGVYTTSKTAALNEGGTTPVIPGNFGYGNHFGSAASFGGNMYVSWYDVADSATTDAGAKYARIYKFDGTTWTVVHAPAADDPSCIPYNQAVVQGGRIYFVSAPQRTTGTNLNRLLYSADGTSWSTVTTSILDNGSGGIMGSITS